MQTDLMSIYVFVTLEGPKLKNAFPLCLFIIGTSWTVTVSKAEMRGIQDLVQGASN